MICIASVVIVPMIMLISWLHDWIAASRQRRINLEREKGTRSSYKEEKERERQEKEREAALVELAAWLESNPETIPRFSELVKNALSNELPKKSFQKPLIRNPEYRRIHGLKGRSN